MIARKGQLVALKGTVLRGIGPDVSAYLATLKAGEEVIETGESCMLGKRGVVYESTSGGGTCARWNLPEGKMGTSLTWGTRRVSEVATVLSLTYLDQPEGERGVQLDRELGGSKWWLESALEEAT